MFKRRLVPSPRDASVLVDPQLGDSSYVASFGYEWHHLDAYVDKEVLSHGHLFGRFLLERDYFRGKAVVDVGCGNGRIGRFIAAQAAGYVGVDLSESVYAFPKHLPRPPSFALVRASGTDLPLDDDSVDVAVCWGVLHHMDDPEAAMQELLRVVRPGGEILVYVYSTSLDQRKNLNGLWKYLPAERQRHYIESLSDAIDSWRDVDEFFAIQLASQVSMYFKSNRDLQILQWFDGVTPHYHWSLQKAIGPFFESRGFTARETAPGCFRIRRPPAKP